MVKDSSESSSTQNETSFLGDVQDIIVFCLPKCFQVSCEHFSHVSCDQLSLTFFISFITFLSLIAYKQKNNSSRLLSKLFRIIHTAVNHLCLILSLYDTLLFLYFYFFSSLSLYSYKESCLTSQQLFISFIVFRLLPLIANLTVYVLSTNQNFITCTFTSIMFFPIFFFSILYKHRQGELYPYMFFELLSFKGILGFIFLSTNFALVINLILIKIKKRQLKTRSQKLDNSSSILTTIQEFCDKIFRFIMNPLLTLLNYLNDISEVRTVKE